MLACVRWQSLAEDLADELAGESAIAVADELVSAPAGAPADDDPILQRVQHSRLFFLGDLARMHALAVIGMRSGG